jgi:hypothetical protein
MVLVEITKENIILSKAALGGLLKMTLNLDRFPTLGSLTEDEREHLGAALSLGVANLEYLERKAGLESAIGLARDVAGPQIITPSKELIVP